MHQVHRLPEVVVVADIPLVAGLVAGLTTGVLATLIVATICHFSHREAPFPSAAVSSSAALGSAPSRCFVIARMVTLLSFHQARMRPAMARAAATAVCRALASTTPTAMRATATMNVNARASRQNASNLLLATIPTFNHSLPTTMTPWISPTWWATVSI